MKPSQADFLLRIAENTYSDGDEAIAEMRRMGAAHMQRILDDEETLRKACEVNAADKKRFAQYLPQQYRSELTQGQAVSQQRTAALPLRKTVE
jgi:hypothetical protein